MDESYWSKRYENNETGWDIGEASKPLIKLFHQFNNKKIRILIPGCGNAYEAEYLYNKGFTNVYIIDISKQPLKNFKNRNPNFPENQILHGDFFEHKESYDLIVEQTFFCAINPELREKYVLKCHELLYPKGELLGVLFNREFEGGPPFGGNVEHYEKLFNSQFSSVNIEECKFSIKPRIGNEVIIRCKK
ncbi:MAG: methyltransferase domain-containing protein [Bacteroidota bacterium]|nr:methyltransferase domain-containing protein [Bacteroidota bacterium]